MPKVEMTNDNIKIHVGDLYKKNEKAKKVLTKFRHHNIGLNSKSKRVSVKYRNKWKLYSYIFSKGQVTLEKRTLVVTDKKTLNILLRLKEKGDLKGYGVEDKTKG